MYHWYVGPIRSTYEECTYKFDIFYCFSTEYGVVRAVLRTLVYINASLCVIICSLEEVSEFKTG